MLELFQIRDLHGSPSPTATDDTDSSTPLPNTTSDPQNRGIIQISSSDYDQIATTHPRARLTYVDDDDGETITVSLSLNLSFWSCVRLTLDNRLGRRSSFLSV
jgi:hypothetical protein